MSKGLLEQRRYAVMSKRGGDDYVETLRTDKKAAEEDVKIFKDCCRRFTWVEELDR